MRMPTDHAPLPENYDDYPWGDDQRHPAAYDEPPLRVGDDGLLTVFGCLLLTLLVVAAEWAAGR